MISEETLHDITQKVIERFNPRRIVLFGSHAQGRAQDESDLDIFIEMESDRTLPERALQVSSLFGLRTWPLDVVVYTPEEVRRFKGDPTSFLCRIETTGRVLYERP